MPVLKGVDLTVEGGEIHALLGANGAGKSTLIKCVSGAVAADGGTVELGGEGLMTGSPRDARRAGVAVIYQEFSLASSLSVAENVFLGTELRAGPFLRRAKQRRRARELLDGLAATHIDVRTAVSSLTAANQQVVEIAKALRGQPRLLILDEPTASLSQREADRLLAQLRQLKVHGIPVIYVTHRLGEVAAIADHVTVLRDGAVVISARADAVAPGELISAIAGGTHAPVEHDSVSEGDRAVVLDVHGLQGPGLGPVDLTVRAGEIIGVYGLLSSGRSELLETLAGVRPRASGDVQLDGRDVSFRRPADAISAGVALVPADRRRQALFMSLSAHDNLLITRLVAYARAGVRGRVRERAAFARLADALSLQPRRPDLMVGRLSGGNQQKIALGRWLGDGDRLHLLMLDEPTQGVDVGARQQLYDVLRKMADEVGVGILFTSSDPEEVETVADRALVLADGIVVGELRKNEISEAELVALAHVEPAGAAAPIHGGSAT